MGLLLDLIVLAVVVLFVALGVKRGFVRTLLETVAVLLALVLAFTLSSPLSEVAYTSFVEPTVNQTVDDALTSYTGKGVTQTVEELWQGNGALANLIEMGGVTKQDVVDGALETSRDGVKAVGDYIKQSVARPAATFLLRVACIALLLLVLLIVFRLLARLLGKLIKFTPLKRVDTLLGAVLGGVKGVLAAVIVCMLLGTLITASANGFIGFTGESIDQSLLFGRLFHLLRIG